MGYAIRPPTLVDLLKATTGATRSLEMGLVTDATALGLVYEARHALLLTPRAEVTAMIATANLCLWMVVELGSLIIGRVWRIMPRSGLCWFRIVSESKIVTR